MPYPKAAIALLEMETRVERRQAASAGGVSQKEVGAVDRNDPSDYAPSTKALST